MRNHWKCAALALILLFLSLPHANGLAQDQTAAERVAALMQAEKYAEARPLIEKELENDSLLNQNQKANYLFQLAFTLLELKEYRASINSWHRLIVLVPNHPMIWGNIGWTYYLESDVDSAIIATKRSLLLKDDQAWVWGNMGLYMLHKGDLEPMQNAYQKAAEHAADADTWDAISKDVADLCADGKRTGCVKAKELLKEGWMICLRRWYKESDTAAGTELVRAHPDDFQALKKNLTDEIASAPEPDRPIITALLERLEKDLK